MKYEIPSSPQPLKLTRYWHMAAGSVLSNEYHATREPRRPTLITVAPSILSHDRVHLSIHRLHAGDGDVLLVAVQLLAGSDSSSNDSRGDGTSSAAAGCGAARGVGNGGRHCVVRGRVEFARDRVWLAAGSPAQRHRAYAGDGSDHGIFLAVPGVCDLSISGRRQDHRQRVNGAGVDDLLFARGGLQRTVAGEPAYAV